VGQDRAGVDAERGGDLPTRVGAVLADDEHDDGAGRPAQGVQAAQRGAGRGQGHQVGAREQDGQVGVLDQGERLVEGAEASDVGEDVHARLVQVAGGADEGRPQAGHGAGLGRVGHPEQHHRGRGRVQGQRVGQDGTGVGVGAFGGQREEADVGRGRGQQAGREAGASHVGVQDQGAAPAGRAGPGAGQRQRGGRDAG